MKKLRLNLDEFKVVSFDLISTEDVNSVAKVNLKNKSYGSNIISCNHSFAKTSPPMSTNEGDDILFSLFNSPGCKS